MVFLGIVLGVVILGATTFMALNKKSSFHTRLVSLGAIAVMILTVIICIIVIFSENKVPLDPSTLIVGAPVEVKDDNTNIIAMVFSIIFLLALFGVILFLAFKEHRKKKIN